MLIIKLFLSLISVNKMSTHFLVLSAAELIFKNIKVI